MTREAALSILEDLQELLEKVIAHNGLDDLETELCLMQIRIGFLKKMLMQPVDARNI